MVIRFKLYAEPDSYSSNVTLYDLDMTENEWSSLEHDEQLAVVQKHVDGLPEVPYWVVEKISEA